MAQNINDYGLRIGLVVQPVSLNRIDKAIRNRQKLSGRNAVFLGKVSGSGRIGRCSTTWYV